MGCITDCVGNSPMLDEPRGHVAKVKLSTYLVAAVAKCYLPCIRHTRPGHTHTHSIAADPVLHAVARGARRARKVPPRGRRGQAEGGCRPFASCRAQISQSPCPASVGGPSGATESRRRSRGGKVEGQIDEPFLHMLVQSSPCSHSPLVPVRFVQMKACIQ